MRFTPARLGLAAAIAVVVAAPAAHAANPAIARAQADWRDAIHKTATPGEGCFTASFPALAWSKVACKAAPNRPFLPRTGAARTIGRTTGNGVDYAIGVTGKISQAVGSFPVAKGVKSETGYGGAANTYSLQLNSNFFATTACAAGSTASMCAGWQQFIYSSSEKAVFMQYWLINYGTTCPTGWASYSGSCYKNSAAVSAPQIEITEIGDFSVSGTAVAGATDTVVFANGSTAYTTTGKDSVTVLASGWNQAEFNVVGDGGGSAAKFNKPVALTVKIAVADGATTAPTCVTNGGTTGETNNLVLGKCVAKAGATPSISFIEKN